MFGDTVTRINLFTTVTLDELLLLKAGGIRRGVGEEETGWEMNIWVWTRRMWFAVQWLTERSSGWDTLSADGWIGSVILLAGNQNPENVGDKRSLTYLHLTTGWKLAADNSSSVRLLPQPPSCWLTWIHLMRHKQCFMLRRLLLVLLIRSTV